MMNNSAPSYLMDHPAEAARLAAKVNAADWVQRFLAPPAAQARRVLDVGCGPGVIAAELARQFPQTEVVGLDLSAARLAEARRQFTGLANAATAPGEATQLPFAAETFDLVFCRFLLEYLPEKAQAVSEMARVCQPGGQVLLQDLDGQMLWHHPPDEALQADLERVLGALGATGFDPFVGRKLFALARTVGLADIVVRADSYHLFAGQIDEPNRRLWEMKLEIALPAAAKALGGMAAAKRLRARFLNYLEREDTLTYSVLFTVTGRKP